MTLLFIKCSAECICAVNIRIHINLILSQKQTHIPQVLFFLLVLLVSVIVKCTYISFVNSEVYYTQLLLGQSVLTGIYVIYL